MALLLIASPFLLCARASAGTWTFTVSNYSVTPWLKGSAPTPAAGPSIATGNVGVTMDSLTSSQAQMTFTVTGQYNPAPGEAMPQSTLILQTASVSLSAQQQQTGSWTSQPKVSDGFNDPVVGPTTTVTGTMQTELLSSSGQHYSLASNCQFTQLVTMTASCKGTAPAWLGNATFSYDLTAFSTELNVNGQPDPNNLVIDAGQPVNMSFTYPQLPNLSTATVQYTIDGGSPIANYTASDAAGVVTQITPASLQQPSVNCFFTDGSSTPTNTPVTVTATATESDPTGQTEDETFTGSATIDLYKPNITLQPITGPVLYTDNGYEGFLSFGTETFPGIQVDANTIVMGAGGTPGDFEGCQLIHSYVAIIDNSPLRTTSCSVDPSLDSAYPYGSCNPFTDWPEADAWDEGYPASISLEISASYYLMWNCNLSGAIGVPVGEVDWNASAVENGGSLTDTAPNVTAVNNSWTTEPQWTNVFSP